MKRRLILLIAGAATVVLLGVLGWHLRRDSKKSEEHSLPSAVRPPSSTSAPVLVDDQPRPQSHAELAEEVKQLAESLVKAFPDDPEAVEIRAQVHYYLGEFSAAAEWWQRCLELDSHYAPGHSGLGVVAAKKGEFETAAAYQREALKLAPDAVDPVLALADALKKLNETREAIAVLEDGLKRHPETISMHNALGQAYLQAREYEAARKVFQDILQRNPEDAVAQFGLASALGRLGKRAEAQKAVKKLKQLRAKGEESYRTRRELYDDFEKSCRDMSVTYAWIGRVYLKHQDPTEAERLWLRAASLDPHGTDCRMYLASLYQRTNRGTQALRMCWELTKIEPENAGFHLNLAAMSANLGLFESAETAYRDVIRLAPQSPEGYSSLARLYLRADKKPAEAVALAQEAVRLAPSYQNYRLLQLACSNNGEPARADAAARNAEALQKDVPR